MALSDVYQGEPHTTFGYELHKLESNVISLLGKPEYFNRFLLRINTWFLL
jgi:hypothetical protein